MKLADAQSIALATGKSYATIRSWIHRGKLKPVTRGLYDLEAAERLVDNTRDQVQHSDRSRTTTPQSE